jgi:hypothetical protein
LHRWVFGSTQRHLGWMRDFRTALGCRPDFLAPHYFGLVGALRQGGGI